jgi:hypothetical protein
MGKDDTTPSLPVKRDRRARCGPLPPCQYRRMAGDDLKLGGSESLLAADREWPIHGLPHRPEAGTSGWYCWTGELSTDPDFFVSLYGSHLVERIPELAEYLALPPGSRFLLTPDYVDVWPDAALPDT